MELQVIKQKVKIKRENVARGHLKELEKKGTTIVKDSAILDILKKQQTNLRINVINGPKRLIINDKSPSWCCTRKLIDHKMIKRLMKQNRIMNIQENFKQILIDKFNSEKAKTMKSIVNILEEEYLTKTFEPGCSIYCWTYYKKWYEVNLNINKTL